MDTTIISIGAGTLPRYLSRLFGNDYLAELCADTTIGCFLPQ